MPSPTDSRSLVLSEGSSNKFWKIDLDGAAHTVTFGRVGTTGQTQNKEFPDEAAARKSFDKLVAEKLKKGYVDSAASPGSAAAKPATAKTAKKAPARAKGEPEATPAVEMAAPASAAAEEAVLTGPREIALDPEDWFRASFRPRPRLERGTPRPFDKEDCRRRLARLKTTFYGWDTRWHDLELAPALSPEEAHFWFLAMTTDRERDTSLEAFADRIARKKITGQLDLTDAREALDRYQRGAPQEIMCVLANLFAPEQLFELMLEARVGALVWQGAQLRQTLVDGFARFVLPYLSEEAREALRRRVRDVWDPTQEPSSDYNPFPVEYYVAASLGMHEEVYQVTSRWPNDRYTARADWADHYQSPQVLVFGLGSAALVESEWRRLKLECRTPDDARGLLACTEYAALDCLAADVMAETNKEKCEALMKVLALVHAPEAAVPVLRCRLASRAAALARAWLDTYVGHAVAGLIETAAGRGSLAEAAVDYLRNVKRHGHAGVIAAALKAWGHPEIAARVQAEVLDFEEKVYPPLDAATTPAWLTAALSGTEAGKVKKLPGWAAPALLPPLLIGDRRMSDTQVGAVLQAIVNTPLGTAHPLLAAIRTHVERHVRDAFAWKLFQGWQGDGYPPAGKWALAAIGHVGDDGCVLKLTPLARAWPGESQHARAVLGLECLRAVGTGVALMQLSGIAQKLKFKGLKARAEQFVEEIARHRGLTRDELEDRVVPDCGLDEDGRRTFSFGPRSFTFVLGGDLKPMLRDAEGKLRGDLPKPGVKDDEATAAAAIAEWKLLKKQIRQVAAVQAERLEKAMVAGRRWAPADFEALLVRHPLMTHLAQKLIWASYDAAGQRLGTFRVTEERDYADADENTFDLAGADRAGVVHPLELTEPERTAWGQVLGDYEIITPFPQLGRKVYTLEEGEASQMELTRFKGLKLVAPTLVGILEKLGWVRGVAMDGGGFDEHSRQFPAAQVTAVVNYEGTVAMGYIDPNEVLTLGSVYFCPGMRAPSGYGWNAEKKVRLGDVSPVVLSEVLGHLHVLKSKAK